MHYEWDERKNKQLQTDRGVCFEDVFYRHQRKKTA
jgi:uncharacterized DUF497 family protein